MPRYKTGSGAAEPGVRNRLVGELACEIRGDADIKSPERAQVFEQAIPQTNTSHVVVVWNKWSNIPSQERGAVILDAYKQADPETHTKITIALGVTLEEALDLDLLPYQVMTMRKESDSVTYEQLEAAMLQEGAARTPFGVHMYFPTQHHAEEAVRRLNARCPGPFWAITQTVTPDRD